MSTVVWMLKVVVMGWLGTPISVTTNYETEAQCEQARASVRSSGYIHSTECLPARKGGKI